MTVWKKQDVRGCLCPVMQKLMNFLYSSYALEGITDFYITSINDGIHLIASFHYIDHAIDFKRQGIPKHYILSSINSFCSKYNLNRKHFDVLEYKDTRDIFHVEYDPVREA